MPAKETIDDRNISLSLLPRLYLPRPLSLRPRLPMLPGGLTSKDCVEPVPAQSTPIAILLDQRRHFLRFLERRVSSPAVAEDILQNAYLRALEHSAALRSDESSTAWFYRILRNAVIDHYRHRTVEDRALEQWAAELETEAAPNELTQDIVCRCIARALTTLRPAYAQILNEVDLAESSLAVFAAAHKITQQNATVRIHRARKALRQRLIETCGTCFAHGCLDCNCMA